METRVKNRNGPGWLQRSRQALLRSSKVVAVSGDTYYGHEVNMAHTGR